MIARQLITVIGLIFIQIIISTTAELDCSEECGDFHRDCPALKNSSYLEQFEMAEVKDQLPAREMSGPLSCDNLVYTMLCPQSCGACKPCSQDQLNANSEQISQLKTELADHATQGEVSQLESEVAQLKIELAYLKLPRVAVELDNGTIITLVKMPIASGYSDDQAGMDKYVATCHGYEAYPIGCGTNYIDYCVKSWNGCVAMPNSWSCEMVPSLHEYTGWDNIVALQAHPDKYKGYNYLYSYKGSKGNPSGSDQLHAVCAL